jgi:hypothetical protein
LVMPELQTRCLTMSFSKAECVIESLEMYGYQVLECFNVLRN